ncbi:response regulator [Patescibacteria group bacterium]
MNKRVLLIDDDTQIRSMVRTALEHANYDVIEASNGLDGLKLAQENEFNCIITDLKMPQMDGLELISELNKLPNVKDCPVVAFSSVTQDYVKEEVAKKGATKLLIKGEATPTELVETISSLT